GILHEGVQIHPGRVHPGDKVLINGPIAAHGMAILSVRDNLDFETRMESDTAPLHELVEAMLKTGADIHVLRDPTRGGVTSALNEIAGQAHVGIHLDEVSIPIREEVHSACEMLGLDPLLVANEGKLVAFVAPEDAD